MSTVSKTRFPTLFLIEGNTSSYIDDGCSQVDKARGNTYTSNNESLTVESHFIGVDSIHNLLKQFLFDIANAMPPQYNDSSNTVVAASTKEGGE